MVALIAVSVGRHHGVHGDGVRKGKGKGRIKGENEEREKIVRSVAELGEWGRWTRCCSDDDDKTER